MARMIGRYMAKQQQGIEWAACAPPDTCLGMLICVNAASAV
jgi:hypothetical protein